MKRIALVLSFFWILAFAAAAAPVAADKAPARHACQTSCCSGGCACCDGGACACADACACCTDGTCKRATCAKHCDNGDNRCKKACATTQEKK